MAFSLFGESHREPADCIIKIDGKEAGALYPYLVEVQIDIQREKAGQALLKFESRRDENGAWTVQDNPILKTWAAIQVEAAFGNKSEPIISGYIVKINAGYPEDQGSATVTVTCQDLGIAMNREHVRKSWGAAVPTTDTVILAEILRKYGLKPHPQNGIGQTGLSLNQDGTDIRFLQKRAEANGYEFFIELDTAYFGPMRVDGQPQAALKVYAGPDTNCYSFNVDDLGDQPDEIHIDTASDKDSSSKNIVVKSELAPMGPEPAPNPPGLPTYTRRLKREGGISEPVLKGKAKYKADQAAMRIRADAELDGSLYGHVLRVGLPVGVDGIGNRLGGIYYVDQVNHHFNHEGYRQKAKLMRNAYGDNFSDTANPLAAIL